MGLPGLRGVWVAPGGGGEEGPKLLPLGPTSSLGDFSLVFPPSFTYGGADDLIHINHFSSSTE